jgi:outer membrane lipoprotein-sorting protein
MKRRIASALAIVIMAAAAASGQTAKNDPQAAAQLRAAYGRLAGLTFYHVGMKMAPGRQIGAYSTDDLVMVIEVAQPDQYRTMAVSDNFGVEYVTVSGQTRYRLTKLAQQPRQPGGDMGVLGFLSAVLPSGLNPAPALIGATSMAASLMLSPSKMTPAVGVWQCPAATLGAGGSQPAAGNTGGEPAVTRLGDVKIGEAAAAVFLATQTSQVQGSSYNIRMRIYVLKESGLPRRVELLDASNNPAMTMDYGGYNSLITIMVPHCGQNARREGPSSRRPTHV